MEERKLSTAGESLYAILGVSKTATREEIIQAYKKMALKYHPDKNSNDPQAKSKFKELVRAYIVLTDKRKRSTYDILGSFGLYVGEEFERKSMHLAVMPGYCLCPLLFCGFLAFGLTSCCLYSISCCCCCHCCCGLCLPKVRVEAREEELPQDVVTVQPAKTETVEAKKPLTNPKP